MPRRRLTAAVLAAALSVGSSVLAACELVCSLDSAAAAAVAVPTHSSGCHESSPATPSRCSERHALRLAVVDAGAGPALAAPPAAPLIWTPPPLESAALLRSSLVSRARPSASPPLILRV